ncbi:MAG: hypothetical protein WCF93_00385 [Candidatus Moraniibacteriota bacterium]
MPTDFIVALNKLHEADPIKVFGNLNRVYLALAKENAEQLVAAYETLSTAIRIMGFGSKQFILINEMLKVIESKMLALYKKSLDETTGSSGKTPEFYLFSKILGKNIHEEMMRMSE